MSRLSWAIVGGAFAPGWAREGSDTMMAGLPSAPTGFRWSRGLRQVLVADKGKRVGDFILRLTLTQWTGRMASAEINMGDTPDFKLWGRVILRHANDLIRHVGAAMSMDPWHEARVNELVAWSYGLPKISVA